MMSGLEAYTDADVDAHADVLTFYGDANTVDCPVCQHEVPADRGEQLRRYAPAPDIPRLGLDTGAVALLPPGPSPVLFTLSCGHRIELEPRP